VGESFLCQTRRQPVAVHRLFALSGGVDLGGYGRVIAVDVDGFFAAEP
jgi:hypothetical protein